MFGEGTDGVSQETVAQGLRRFLEKIEAAPESEKALMMVEVRTDRALYGLAINGRDFIDFLRQSLFDSKAVENLIRDRDSAQELSRQLNQELRSNMHEIHRLNNTLSTVIVQRSNLKEELEEARTTIRVLAGFAAGLRDG